MDIQVRAYAINEPRKQVEERVAAAGLPEARRMAGGYASAREAEEGSWKNIAITFDLHYRDYGGTAVVDCWLREVGAKTFVFVFFHTEGDGDEEMKTKHDTIREIIDSFQP
jgi:nickel-dependent lactate racemase